MPDQLTEIAQQAVESQPQVPAAASTQPQAAAPASAQGDARVVHMPTHAVGRLKKEALEKGRKAAMQELAMQGGFSSVEEMLLQMPKVREALAARDATPAPQPRAQPKPAAPGQRAQSGSASNDRAVQKLQREKDELARRMKRETLGRKRLQKELDARDAEMVLREAAVASGVRDVDYAVRLLSRHLEGKEETELTAFDESSYFKGLRDTHPYLFGEKHVPANTGAGSNAGAPPAPKPGAVAQVQAQSGQIDTRKMSSREFADHLRSRGLQMPVA